MNNDFVIIGGDLRFKYLAELFKQNDLSIKSYGFEKLSNTPESSLKDIISDFSAIILPLPVSKDENFINAPFSRNKIPLNYIYSQLNNTHTVFGGNISDSFKNVLEVKNVKYFDYAKDETFISKNAYLTAEGAVMTAIAESDISLSESKCLITGYGRISKFLLWFLKSFNADVTVCARKEKDLASASSFGCKVCHINNISNALPNCDIIFNTVPAIIFTENEFKNFKKDSCIIDLASNPGGVDINCLKNSNINYARALSLPGKTAPKTAGKLIFESILKILNQNGEDIYDF